jgi:hypothetical protein
MEPTECCRHEEELQQLQPDSAEPLHALKGGQVRAGVPSAQADQNGTCTAQLSVAALLGAQPLPSKWGRFELRTIATLLAPLPAAGPTLAMPMRDVRGGAGRASSGGQRVLSRCAGKKGPWLVRAVVRRGGCSRRGRGRPR